MTALLRRDRSRDPSGIRCRGCLAALLLAGALVAPVGSGASVWITNSPVRPTLGVDAKGNALVSWTEGGTRKTVLVPPRGQLFHGGSLSGRDVSRPTRVRGLPSVVTVRRTPDGRLWALQRWRKRPGAPVELHLARWTGAPTKLSLAFDGTRLTGRVTFHGKPVTGVSPTLEGKRVRVYVFLDCLKCAAGGKGWGRMLGVASKRDGSFSVLVRSSWRGKRYRATVLGPNLGTTLAPNALATAR